MTSARTSTSQRLGNSEDVAESVRKARQTAIEMMKKAGFDIGTKVKVVVDPKLPFVRHLVNQQSLYKSRPYRSTRHNYRKAVCLRHRISHERNLCIADNCDFST